MSKNSELLQQADKLHDISSSSLDQSRPSLPIDTEASAPVLEVGETARGEITKLVRRLFQIPGAEAPRVVVFAGTETGNGAAGYAPGWASTWQLR